MPAEKYHKTYLKEQLSAEIKEHRREDRLDPTRLPTYEYLNAKGFNTRGLTKAIQRHFGDEMTLHQFLKEQGFGQGDSDWPTTHGETIEHLNGFSKSRLTRNNDRPDTHTTMKSAMREVLRTVQELHGTDNLLLFARHETEDEKYKRNEQIEAVIDEIREKKSDGATENYVRYLRFFYEYVSPRARIDTNPVKEVESQYGFDTNPEKDPNPLTDDQIDQLWRTLKQLPERRTLSDSVENIAARYGLRTWQIYMMVLVILGIAVGPRSKEYIRTNCREDWNFGENPYIEFPVRKNLPGQVPILAHPEFLMAFRDYMEATIENWNGKPFPNPRTKSGSRTPMTLNNWLAALCEEADVRLDDGSYPTLQNLRQTWHTEYLKVLRIDDVRLKLVADEAGTKDEDQPKISYRSDEEERKGIRSLITRDFEELLPLSKLPDEMAEVLDEEEYIETQADLSDF